MSWIQEPEKDRSGLRVRFREDLVQEIRFEDDEESRSCRIGCWNIDAQRFRDRIRAVEAVLVPVFDPSHRQRVFHCLSEGSAPPAVTQSFLVTRSHSCCRCRPSLCPPDPRVRITCPATPPLVRHPPTLSLNDTRLLMHCPCD